MVRSKEIVSQFNYEAWVPWIIGILVVLVVFPYEKIKEYFIFYKDSPLINSQETLKNELLKMLLT